MPFVKLSDKSYSFSSCETCGAACCDGSKDILFAQILLSDFERVSKNFPILFTIGSKGYARPVVLLTNGKDFCKYINNFKCSIYEDRPSICRTYPVSANIDDEVYIDTSCPAVSTLNDKPSDNKNIYKQFNNPILKEYGDKYSETLFHFYKYNKKENFDLVFIINEVKFYKFNNTFDSKYLELHQKSLQHLNDEYFRFVNSDTGV